MPNEKHILDSEPFESVLHIHQSSLMNYTSACRWKTLYHHCGLTLTVFQTTAFHRKLLVLSRLIFFFIKFSSAESLSIEFSSEKSSSTESLSTESPVYKVRKSPRLQSPCPQSHRLRPLNSKCLSITSFFMSIRVLKYVV